MLEIDFGLTNSGREESNAKAFLSFLARGIWKASVASTVLLCVMITMLAQSMMPWELVKKMAALLLVHVWTAALVSHAIALLDAFPTMTCCLNLW